MDKNKFTSLLLLACALLWACSDEDTPVDQSKAYPAIIMAEAFGYEVDGTGTTWSKGETIGVSMLKSGTDEIVPPYSNLRYYANSFDNQDYFLPGCIDSIPYFPPTGETMDIAAYYPQSTVLADSLVAIHLIENYEYASKLLYSRAQGLHKDQRRAELLLRPALTLLTFKFKVGYGMTEADLKGLIVTLKGLPVSGNFNTLTGKIHFRDVTTSQDIQFTATEKKAASRALALASNRALTRAEDKDDEEDGVFITAQGMVLPASTTEGYSVIVELPAVEKSYTYDIPKGGTEDFEGSQEYTFDSEITNEDMIVTVQSSPIINWGQGGIINGEGEENKQ